MQTPKVTRQLRSPRCSERKKSLFTTKRSNLAASGDGDDDDFLDGITKLEPMDDDLPHARDENTDDVLKRSSDDGRGNASLSPSTKDNVGDDLQELFSASMSLSARKKSKKPKSPDLDQENVPKVLHRDGTQKRQHGKDDDDTDNTMSPTLSAECPQRKVAKMNVSNIDTHCISTKSFYSSNATATKSTNSCKAWMGIGRAVQPASPRSSKTPSPRSRRRKDDSKLNRGVRHKIRKPVKSGIFGGGMVRKSTSLDIDDILKNVRNEKLHKLIAAKREERSQIAKVHDIFRRSNNPIEMARPLSALGGSVVGNTSTNSYNNNNNNIEGSLNKNTKSKEADFSDLESESDDDVNEYSNEWENTKTDIEEPIIPYINHDQGAITDALLDTGITQSEAPIQSKRKFFKSGQRTQTKKEIQITGNIKASVCNGKISLLQKKKTTQRRRVRKPTVSMHNQFSDEQATVDAILKNLDDTLEPQSDRDGARIMNAASDGSVVDEPQHFEDLQPQTERIIDVDVRETESHDPEQFDEYSEYRKRLPYNTNDPELIDQQNLLLDFLISNNICTERNFTIFIGEPDQHKDEAQRIVDEVIMVVNEAPKYRSLLPYETDSPELILQQNQFLDFLIDNDICTDETFDIFIANYETRFLEAHSIIANIQDGQQYADGYASSVASSQNEMDTCIDESNMPTVLETTAVGPSDSHEATTDDVPAPSTSSQVIDEDSSTADCVNEMAGDNSVDKLFPIFYAGRCQPLVQTSTRTRSSVRSWSGGLGENQYQIDAGQKEYGAKQCKQCGLIYTVHEPEEEKLHRDFHTSLHVLRFKGWIDEDVVGIFTEWGPDGRILRVTECSQIKRRERLMDILKIVDKELGFSSYILPQNFVAYLAVRKSQIVGLCLVQALAKANKYLCIKGVDCCTTDEFDAMCGVSRIWVSPLHRRLHIATKLTQAVQMNTIVGEMIPLTKIAFSAPTEAGKDFAKRVTGMENFLVYQ